MLDPRERGEIPLRRQVRDAVSVSGERLLVAVGRRPLTADLGLETVGLEPGRYLEVDDGLQVAGKEWLYAVGDVNGRSLLTHSGKYQARVAADRILGGNAVAVADGPTAPRVIFTDPQVAAVGPTRSELWLKFVEAYERERLARRRGAQLAAAQEVA